MSMSTRMWHRVRVAWLSAFAWLRARARASATAHALSSSSSRPRTVSTLVLLTLTPSAPATAAATASTTTSLAPPPPPHAVPRHRIFDAKHVDVRMILHVLDEWIGADTHPDALVHHHRRSMHDPRDFAQSENHADHAAQAKRKQAAVDAREADRTAISLALVDARFFTSLYHHYHVRQTLKLDAVQRTWQRRIADMSDAYAERERERGPQPSSRDDFDSVNSSLISESNNPSNADLITWFMPRFGTVMDDVETWSAAAATTTTTIPPWLLDRIDDKVLAFAEAPAVVAVPLPLTAVRVDYLERYDRAKLVVSLEHLPHLRTFQFHYAISREGDPRPVCAALCRLHCLTHLDLSLNFIDGTCGLALATALEHLPQLKWLNLGSAGVDAAACCAIAGSLRHTPHLTTLDLSWNRIGTEGLGALAAALSFVPDLTLLNLRFAFGERSKRSAGGGGSGGSSSNESEAGGAADCWLAFAASLRHVRQLAQLNIVGLEMPLDSARVLADALVQLPQLTCLDRTAIPRDDDMPAVRVDYDPSPVERFVLDLCMDNRKLSLHTLDVYRFRTAMLSAVTGWLPHLPNLTTLRLRYGVIDEEARWIAFADALRHVPHVTELDLCGHVMSVDLARRVFVGVREHLPRIRTVNRVSASSVVGVVRNGGATAVLDFADVYVGPLDMLFLSALFERERERERQQHEQQQDDQQLPQQARHLLASTTSLNLPRCYIGETGCDALATLLPNLPRLTSLSVDMNGLGPPGARALCAALRHAPQLASLSARTNFLGEQGCRELSAIEAPNLTHLDLGENVLEERGAPVLAEWLPRVPQLTSLNVSKNGMDGAKFATLAAAFDRLPQLASLVVSLNEIGKEGGCALAAALQHVPRLTELDVSDCAIGEEAWATALAPALEHVPNLTRLVASGNRVRVPTVVGALRHTPRLRSLNLSNMIDTDDGCVALASLFRHRGAPDLQSLDLSWSIVENRGYLALASALLFVPQLTRLIVGADSMSVVSTLAFWPFRSRLTIVQKRWFV